MVGTGVVCAALAFVLGIVRPDVPYPEAARLASVNAEERFALETALVITGAMKERLELFDRVVIYKDNFAVRLEDDSSPSTTALAGSHDLLETLGIRPSIGRLFSPEEDEPGRGASIVLSDRAWRTRFGADPNILGTSVVLRGFDTLDISTVVGVLAPDDRFPVGPGAAPDFYLPLGNRHGRELMQNAAVLGRLAPGRSQREAKSWFESVAPRLTREFEDRPEPLLSLDRYHGVDVGGQTRALLAGLLGVAGLALTVSVLNVAMLAWLAAMQRSRAFAIRLALGAPRWRVRAALVGRCLGPVALGCGLGILAVGVAIIRLRAVIADEWASLVPELSWPVASAAVATYVMAAALGSLWPTQHILGLDVGAAMRRPSGSHGGIDDRRLRPIVVAQVSVVAALLMLGSLFATAVDRHVRQDRGFDVANQAFFEVRLGDEVRDEEIGTSIGDLLENPVLRSAGAALGDPPLPGRIVPLPSMVRSSLESPPLIGRTWLSAVSAGYAAALGVDLVAGRFFSDSEAEAGLPVAVLDTSTARALDLREPVVGRSILVRIGGEWRTAEVVGLVESLRLQDARTREPIRQVYLPYGLAPARTFPVVLRSPASAGAFLERLMPSADVGPPLSLESMYRSDAFAQLLAFRSLRMGAALGLALALGGLFAVLTQATERRRSEFGIRLAVGASAIGVAWMTLRSGLKLSALGLAVGTAAAIFTAGMLQSALLGVPAWEVRAIGVTAFVIVAASSLALVHPAVSAARSDPADLMREE
jgi:predicted permease